MSHEIRTPMNAIMGMADLLAETPLTGEQAEYVGLFRRAGDTLLTLIDDILDLSKVEAGQLTLEATAFDLRAVAADAAAVLAGRAQGKGLALTCAVAPDVPAWVVGDPQRLRQVLLNLLGNAVKFTARGEVDLRLERDAAGAPPPAGGGAAPVAVRFSVRDTGIGIPAGQQAAVFGAFTQGDASTTRRYGGTGLGLHIVERLVALMGGRIAVASTPGHGATFAFTLQLAPAAAGGPVLVPAAAASPAAPGGEGAGAGAPGRRVLLVDDSADNRRLVQLYLRRLPYALETAPDGRAGLDAFTSGAYDLVLMDVHMPVLDGLAATRALRAWERERGRPPTPVIALTASVMAEDVRQALAAGCDAHLAKPLKKATLLAALTRFAAPGGGQGLAVA